MYLINEMECNEIGCTIAKYYFWRRSWGRGMCAATGNISKETTLVTVI